MEANGLTGNLIHASFSTLQSVGFIQSCEKLFHQTPLAMWLFSAARRSPGESLSGAPILRDE